MNTAVEQAEIYSKNNTMHLILSFSRGNNCLVLPFSETLANILSSAIVAERERSWDGDETYKLAKTNLELRLIANNNLKIIDPDSPSTPES